MDFWIWILIAVIICYILWIKLYGRVGVERAQELIKEGALVLDVRTQQEYAEKHLAKAVNIPMHEVSSKIAAIEPDKERVILCHCASGGRSGIAMGKLRRLGYKQAYNLGSINQATTALKE